MSRLSAQCDELRVMAGSVGLSMTQAATLMMRAADTIDRLDAENGRLREYLERKWYLQEFARVVGEYVRLRELAREMHATISRYNSWWDYACKDTRRFADELRELGVES